LPLTLQDGPRRPSRSLETNANPVLRGLDTHNVSDWGRNGQIKFGRSERLVQSNVRYLAPESGIAACWRLDPERGRAAFGPYNSRWCGIRSSLVAPCATRLSTCLCTSSCYRPCPYGKRNSAFSIVTEPPLHLLFRAGARCVNKRGAERQPLPPRCRSQDWPPRE
jgi:hypothetical protein